MEMVMNTDVPKRQGDSNHLPVYNNIQYFLGASYIFFLCSKQKKNKFPM